MQQKLDCLLSLALNAKGRGRVSEGYGRQEKELPGCAGPLCCSSRSSPITWLTQTKEGRHGAVRKNFAVKDCPKGARAYHIHSRKSRAVAATKTASPAARQ